MKRGLYAVLAGAATLVVASTHVRAEDVGCCRTECTDGVRVGVRIAPTPASECRDGTPGCSVEWSPEPCGGVAIGGAVGQGDDTGQGDAP